MFNICPKNEIDIRGIMIFRILKFIGLKKNFFCILKVIINSPININTIIIITISIIIKYTPFFPLKNSIILIYFKKEFISFILLELSQSE